VSGETLLVGDQAGTFFALDRRTGEERWRFRAGPFQSSAVVTGDLILVGSDDGYLYALRGSDGPGLRRAVFWDESLFSLYDGHAELKDFLAGSGYEVLDAPALEAFMAERVEDGAPSAIVFAMDHVPARVGAAAADTILFRRYLDAGGRVVWLGYPPFSIEWDPESGGPVGVDLGRTTAVTGVDHAESTVDEYSAWPTEEGRAWGLEAWGIDRLGVEPDQVDEVLALDGHGLATAWVKRYGEGGALVRLWGRRAPLPDPAVVRRLAEQELR
jgi:hypothetical protein